LYVAAGTATCDPEEPKKDVDVPALEAELPAPLDVVMPAIGDRPGTDEGAGGGTAEFMPESRDPPATVTTAVAVSVINDSETLFDEVAPVRGEDVVVSTVAACGVLAGEETRLGGCELVIALVASLPASLLKGRIGFSSTALLQFWSA
jgi:hypothetical protein